jgi:ElaB/YqjD/DUF883 family membrane-anchored ribosome-binding protein
MSTSQTYRSTSQGANNAVDKLASAAQDTFNSAVDQAQTMAQDQYDKLTASIRRNPLQAAGIAAGIGFVLALLARR